MATVVFDLDGTLVDSAADLLAAANACFDRPMLGPDDALTAFQGGRAMLRLGYQRLGLAGDIDRDYARLLTAYADAICVASTLYPGVVAAVEALRGMGHATAICTNKPEGLAVDLVRQLGIAGLFDALVGADTLPVRKPDAAPYRLAVERAGGGRSMLVGDTETDRLTGLAAGVPVVLVTFGPEGQGVARLQPDALLDRYEDLPRLVQQILG
ncbi:MAG: HAD hydrolase-like protein [Pseudorhodobacter sp.]|nr:HAD hydrolase-like protein [Pseudorhodobacter sp.]